MTPEKIELKIIITGQLAQDFLEMCEYDCKAPEEAVLDGIEGDVQAFLERPTEEEWRALEEGARARQQAPRMIPANEITSLN